MKVKSIGIKERKTDKMFSDLIRARDNWQCLACLEEKGESKDYSENKQGLHCSHYWSRRHENTRFDPENCISLCRYHHQFAWGHGDGRNEYTAFMIKRLGQQGFDMLNIRHTLTKKRDDKLDEIAIKYLKEEFTQRS
jgi:hypothetical protein